MNLSRNAVGGNNYLLPFNQNFYDLFIKIVSVWRHALELVALNDLKYSIRN